MWLTYDDLQSNTVKNNYILQQKLGGAMFWEFSCDRNIELIGNTYKALFGGDTTPSGNTTSTTTGTTNGTTTATTTGTTNGTTTATTTQTTTTSGDILPWTVGKAYNVGDKVTYEGKTYQCLEAHTSQSDWTPTAAPSLWAPIESGRFFGRWWRKFF